MMTTEDLKTRAGEYKALWMLLFPEECPPPCDRQFAIWLANFSESFVEKAIKRTSAKFAMGGLNPERTYRYCTGVMNNLIARRKAAQQ